MFTSQHHQAIEVAQHQGLEFVRSTVELLHTAYPELPHYQLISIITSQLLTVSYSSLVAFGISPEKTSHHCHEWINKCEAELQSALRE